MKNGTWLMVDGKRVAAVVGEDGKVTPVKDSAPPKVSKVNED